MGRQRKTQILIATAVVVAVVAAALGYDRVVRARSMLDEDIVHAHYQAQINALRAFDAEPQCRAMAPAYRGVDVLRTSEGEDREVMDRNRACIATRQFMTAVGKIVARLDQSPQMQFAIRSVALSEDRTRATVGVHFSLRIGDRFSATSTGTEVLVRREGVVYVLRSDSSSAVVQH